MIKEEKSSSSVACWDFDSLALSIPGTCSIKVIENSEISIAYSYVKNHFNIDLAPLSIVKQVYEKNKNSFYLIHRDAVACGVYALLFLNSLGLEMLLLSELDLSDVNIDCLTEERESPAAIYKWIIAAPNAGLDAFKCMSGILLQNKFKYANLFLRATTSAGKATSKKLGFTPIRSFDQSLRRYIRHANRQIDVSRGA